MAIPSVARSWVDIVPPDHLKLHDYRIGFAMVEEDPFLSIETATRSPLPLVPATAAPAASPSSVNPPTNVIIKKTPQPTTAPTTVPSTAPTKIPTTPSPTKDPYPENPVPDFPDPIYFNYDPGRGNPYGPGYPELQRYNQSTLAVGYENNGWANTGVGDDFYWNEFDDEKGYGPWQGVLSVRSPERNRCDRIGKQSPIDLRPSGAECIEHHQIRVRVSFVQILSCIFRCRLFKF